MLVKMEGKRKRGQQKMRWLDSTDSMNMNLSELQERAKDREAWHAASMESRVRHDLATEHSLYGIPFPPTTHPQKAEEDRIGRRFLSSFTKNIVGNHRHGLLIYKSPKCGLVCLKYMPYSLSLLSVSVRI